MKKLHESQSYELWAPVLGRVLIASLFIIAGLGKLMDFAGTVAFATAFNVPFPEVAIVIAIIIELGGGLLLLFGFWSRLVAFKIGLFLLVVTLFFHTDFADQAQMMQFLKNMAIIGGLLYVSVHGARKAALKKCDLPHNVHEAH
ncbi:DoxX family protein [Candidatus Wolfebacteria bacterium]|nr:DoxX family protein [Candidatus Wolfebacteria bacterium]